MARKGRQSAEVCTPQELAFVAAYLADPDGQKAAEAAGYSAKSKNIAQVLLSRPRVLKEIERQRDARSVAAGVTQADVIKQLQEICFLDIGELVDENNKLLPIKKLPEHVRRAISHLELVTCFGEITAIKPMPVSKAKAIALLMEQMGMRKPPEKSQGGGVVVNLDFNFSDPVQAPKAVMKDGHTLEITIPSKAVA